MSNELANFSDYELADALDELAADQRQPGARQNRHPDELGGRPMPAPIPIAVVGNASTVPAGAEPAAPGSPANKASRRDRTESSVTDQLLQTNERAPARTAFHPLDGMAATILSPELADLVSAVVAGQPTAWPLTADVIITYPEPMTSKEEADVQ